jgi:hypothetical protein
MPNLFRVVISGLLWGNTWNNVLHFHDSDTGKTPVDMATDINVNFLSRHQALCHNQLQYLDIEAKMVHPALSIPHHLSINKIGTVASATSNDNPTLATLIRLKTLTPGKHGRGRFYMPGVPQAGTNIGIFNAGHLALIQTKVNEWKSLYTGPTAGTVYRICVAPRSNPSAFIECVDIIPVARVANQRRRNYGVGI